jgi:hypothetical protein
MLDAGYLINKKERLLVLSSISPRRRLYEPEARDQYLASRDILYPNVPTKLDINFKILTYIDI